MLTSLNLSHRDAWSRVSQYVGLWILFWLVFGLAGQGFDLRPTLTSSDTTQLSSPWHKEDFDQFLSRHLRKHLKKPATEASDAERLSDRDPLRARTSLSANTAKGASNPTEIALLSKRDRSNLASGFTASAPAGFADLLGIQNTQADVYFQGRLLVSTFIEFDLEHIWFMAPEEVVDAIPTLKNPEQVIAALSGELPSNSNLLCSVRVRTNCGKLSPDIAGVIFNESKFRIDLFVAQDELEVQLVVGDRYLPEPTAGWGTLHDLGFSASGQFDDNRYSLTGESFLSKGSGRARVRYGLTNSGASLHEASLQFDRRDREYEFGAFRTARGNSLFVNDRRLLGVRLGSSTKTRTDLDNALATPIFSFLTSRSRVDILRGSEILDSRFYEAGNHQLDTTRLPDGAYDILVKTVGPDGSESFETHFFVRNSLLPPLGEKQYFVEAGAFTQAFGSDLPRTVDGGWVRAGLSSRLNESFALEAEALVSNEVSLLQGGAYLLGRGWQVYAGALGSVRGDSGFSFRGQLDRGNWGLSLNAQHLNSKTETSFQTLDLLDPEAINSGVVDSEALGLRLLDSQSVLGGSFTQASAGFSFPLRLPLLRGTRSPGRAILRARYNKRDGRAADTGIGLSYFTPLFSRRNVSADLNLEALYATNQSLVRIGFDLRWRGRGQNSSIRPELVARRSSSGSDGTSLSPALNGLWSRSHHTDSFGDVTEGAYLTHDDNRSVVGGRLSSQSKFGFSELDLSYQNDRQDSGRSGLAYATNSRFSLVSTEGKSALGGGAGQLAAIVVEIDGDLPNTEFQVILGSRVAGYASSNKRAVVSVRPYQTYSVKIQPTGDSILGYDERSYAVTLYPGNVHKLVFAARSLHVLVSQAVYSDGAPVSHGKFVNVEGFGATDEQGWFQVELAHQNPLTVRLPSGDFCELTPPPLNPDDDDLAVVDALVCRSIPAPPSS